MINIPTHTEVFHKHPQVETQLEKIESHLLKHKSITSWESIRKYNVTRLSQYILMLRNKGFNISTVWETKNKKRYGVYILED